MSKIIVVLLVLGVVGCAGNMPVHFQQNNPLRTTPNQIGTPIYTDTQAIIDSSRSTVIKMDLSRSNYHFLGCKHWKVSRKHINTFTNRNIQKRLTF